jgi:hypothetical protein
MSAVGTAALTGRPLSGVCRSIQAGAVLEQPLVMTSVRACVYSRMHTPAFMALILRTYYLRLNKGDWYLLEVVT